MSNGDVNVFAASDRPVIIYTRSEKLVFVNVNLRSAVFVTGFSIDGLDGCLAIASKECLSVGKVELVQRLHVKQIPFGETVSRIIYFEEKNVFGIITSSSKRLDDGSVEEFGMFKILDPHTFKGKSN